MTVEKLDTSKLQPEHKGFTQHIAYVVQNLKDPIALAVWCYMSSLPTDWEFHKTHLMEHFSLGRDRLNDALALLKSSDLVQFIRERRPDGTLGKGIIVVKPGYGFHLVTENQYVGDKPVDKNQLTGAKPAPRLHSHLVTEKPASGLPVTGQQPLHKIYKHKIYKTKKDREHARKERVPLSVIFKPSQACQTLAIELNLDLNVELESFMERHKGNKSDYEFERWLKNSYSYQQRKIANKPLEPKSNIQWWEPGNPDYDRVNGTGKKS